MREQTVKRISRIATPLIALAVGVTLGILTSCTTDALRGDCVPRALYQASARRLILGQDVRFIVSNVSPGLDHIQAQFLVGSEWVWSIQHGDWISQGANEFPSARVYKVLTWEQLVDELSGKMGSK